MRSLPARAAVSEFRAPVPRLPDGLGPLSWTLLFTPFVVMLIVRLNKGTKEDDATLDKLRKRVDEAKVKKALQEAEK